MTSITATLTIACVVAAGAIPRIANADNPPRGETDSGEAIRSAIDDTLKLNAQVGSPKLNSGVQSEDVAETPSPPSESRMPIFS